jgi:TIR domain
MDKRTPYMWQEIPLLCSNLEAAILQPGTIPPVCSDRRWHRGEEKGEQLNEIFLSYRWADEKGTTGRLFDHLVQAFGKDAIFYDVATIPHGVDFREMIDRTIRNCRVVLVVIGPLWLNMQDQGMRRLDQVNDPVRIEIETALRWRKRIIPVLIDDAQMPTEESLPATIAQLASQNAAPMHNNQYFEQDINALLSDIASMGVPRKYSGFIANPPSAGLPTMTRTQTAAAIGLPVFFIALGLIAVLVIGYFAFAFIGNVFKDFNHIGGLAGVATDTPSISQGVFDVTITSSVTTFMCNSGQPGPFKVTLRNDGGGSYTYALQITDQDPAGKIWASGSGNDTGTLRANSAVEIGVTPVSSLCVDMKAKSQTLISLKVTVKLIPVVGGAPFTKEAPIGVFGSF